MNEKAVTNQWNIWREYVIELVEEVPEHKIDVIPEGFNNNIRWNMGHLLVGWDDVVTKTLEQQRRLPEEYHLMFGDGSSPSDWKETPPSYKELVSHLKDQPKEFSLLIEGNLNAPLKHSFFQMNSLGEMCQFLTAHESLHLGTMNSIRKII
ncbi:hypothetical protein CEY16_10195 [Halalkalibacillus sediminis]|uniref:DinB-like domain-containing protein n=1 Tax=Halalkalibacillus sediminis TaxID=2018042 RepID=A0A2I0QS08_9BACI|nr:DinB family protein [Halalkalibacillus sediminis]PKR77108.1 hypothetical protein CEY16_10195 [Halalkalibacillus sediminis]